MPPPARSRSPPTAPHRPGSTDLPHEPPESPTDTLHRHESPPSTMAGFGDSAVDAKRPGGQAIRGFFLLGLRADCRVRTDDLRFTRAVLYQLS